MASLKDIAESAGISIRTVKRALSGQGYVSPETRTRVLQAAESLDYHPNLAARALKTGKSSEISVIVHTVEELHMEKLAGMEQALRRAGYSLHILFTAVSDADSTAETLRALASRRPAGVAVFGSLWRSLGEQVALLGRRGIPYVVMDSRDAGVDGVRIDRQSGVYDAVKYLAQSGRKRIAYFGSRSERSRLDGYERGIREVGSNPVIVDTTGSQTDQEAFEATLQGVLGTDAQPDAFQAYSDVVAMGLLRILHRRDIRVPDEIAVVGFDDRQFAALACPRLTTVAQPNREVGAAAAEILLAKIQGQAPPAEGWSRTLPTRLVVRESA